MSLMEFKLELHSRDKAALLLSYTAEYDSLELLRTKCFCSIVFVL